MAADFNSFAQFSDLVARRYSCRAYDPARPVDRDMLRAIMEQARMAPSACNRQPWHFVVIDRLDDPMRMGVLESYDREWMVSAPVLVVACGYHHNAWHRAVDQKDHTDVDVSIAVEHICLAAASMGLGSCWVCNFDPDRLRLALGLPDGSDIEPIAIIPIGYPAEGTVVPSKKREELDTIVTWRD